MSAAGAILRWGDPEAAFVGDPDGDPPDHTGYGVYAAPIARAAARAGAPVLASGTGITPASLYAAVVAGHPAVAWVTNDYRADAVSTWQAWDGAEVRYSLHEHAVTVIGVTPTLVLLDDPYFGQRWHSRAEFEASYGTLGDMAVILG
ncbi:MAG TPA: C39 family peptidase [Candidatus Dormibacteraeota bacterium]